MGRLSRRTGRAYPASAVRSIQLQRNLYLLCGFRALQMSLFPVAIVTLFWIQNLGLSMTQVFWLQAAFGLFTALFEFPGGYVSDRIGYRNAMLVASALSVLGWLVQGLAVGFWSILPAEVLLAAAFSLTSGTDAALLYESLLELGDEPAFARWFGRSRSLGAIAEGTAALVAGLLFVVSPRLPFFLQAAVWGLNTALVWLLLEPARVKEIRHDAWTHVTELVRFVAIESPALRQAIIAGLALGLSTFAPVWIIAIYAEDQGVPIAWIGPMWAVANYCVAIGSWRSHSLSGRLGTRRTLVLCTAMIALGFLGLGLSTAVWAFAFYYPICFARGLNGPILGHVQQRLIPSSDRATLLSVQSLLFRGSFFVIGPALGFALDEAGHHPVLLFCAVASTAICLPAIASMSEPASEPS